MHIGAVDQKMMPEGTTKLKFDLHPSPDPVYFNANMQRIMTETKAGEYVRVVQETLGHLYSQSGKAPPHG